MPTYLTLKASPNRMPIRSSFTMIFNNRKAKGIPHLSIKRETEPPALTKDMYLIMINKTES